MRMHFSVSGSNSESDITNRDKASVMFLFPGIRFTLKVKNHVSTPKHGFEFGESKNYNGIWSVHNSNSSPIKHIFSLSHAQTINRASVSV